MVRETRHLWVGNLPENVRDDKIIEHFKRYGRIESVKILPKRGTDGGVAAFVDFVDVKSAQKAHNAVNKMGDRDLRTDYNERGAVRVLDEAVSITSRSREVSGFRGGGGGPTYGPPQTLHTREGRYERRLDGYGYIESVDILPNRRFDGDVAGLVKTKSAKAHNAVNKMGDRDFRRDYNEPGTIPGTTRVFDETAFIRTPRREVLVSGGGSSYGSPQSLYTWEDRYLRRFDGTSETRERTYEHSAYGHHERGTGGFERTRHYDQDYYRDPRDRTLQHGIYYSSRRSPSRFDAHDPRYESRTREQFTLPSVVHRDIYRNDITREVRGRRPERNYQHSRSRSPHSSQSPRRRARRASTPARSPSGSGSRSRSSNSRSLSSSHSTRSSTSNDSRDCNSTSGDECAAEPRKSFGIKVENLPMRSSDKSLKEGLFFEFKKYGKVTSVQIHGEREERYGLVFFRQQEDKDDALNASKSKRFLGMQIEVTAWEEPETVTMNELRPPEEKMDEFHPKANRTLFVGNLEETTTCLDLQKVFEEFGEILNIDIKKVNGVPRYAFLQYCDITSVCKAIKKMDGQYLGENRLKVGFGKCMPTNCVGIHGLFSTVPEESLRCYFSRYGPVLKVVYDRVKGMALVRYGDTTSAKAAVDGSKGRKIGGNSVKVEFANPESQLAFYGPMESSRQEVREKYETISETSDTSSTSGDECAAVPASPSQPLLSSDEDEPRRSFGIRVQNLPVRSSDTSLKDGLFFEFKKYGRMTSVQIHGERDERYGLVFFRQQEDRQNALNASKSKRFLGMQIEVTAWEKPETESENEFRPLEEKIDEFHPKATRSLFIGNLEKTTTRLELHNVFQRFGEIVDIDVKKVNGIPQYAFLQYCDITSVCKAIKKMDGEYLGKNRLKVGFGKSMPTNCVWIDGLSSSVTEQYLARHFSRYGLVLKVVYDDLKGMALVLYKGIECALTALKETKGRKIGGNLVKVDFANQGSQLAFYSSMGLDVQDVYEIVERSC
ncbi:msx2-interacting protein-like isoform X2 [Mixophyes fleayi]|uniref:msx2-interacting protein-like isoform X2 n=1 Tax=Mixophyes fleayi TaxID=3061075 RepID=UPI003F4E2411